MVIVKLLGGLGNQMFQYAFGRRTALCNGVPLKLDISGFANYPKRNYELAQFAISAEMATQDEVRRHLGRPGIRGAISRFVGKKPLVVHEQFFHVDESLLSLGDNVYLDGYWQSEKYFLDVQDVIRTEFTLKTPYSGQTTQLADLIAKTNAVSLHVRRGDYVAERDVNAIHGTCSLAYYRDAIRLIEERVANPHFFIFSDDLDWTRNNLQLAHSMTLVEFDVPESAAVEMQLMSLCRHHIIANSTFSWWGAWLNRSQHKIVVAPRQWFQDASRDVRDLYPDNWIVL